MVFKVGFSSYGEPTFFILSNECAERKMTGFEKVALVNEITPGSPKRIKVGDYECVLFCIGEQIFAFENLCPHQRYSAFHQGVLDQYTITCPMHGWSFDVRTGKAITGNGHLNILEVRVDRNSIWVKKSDDEKKLTYY
jgi:nitrite reductase/ring-hydroxylating ferredoxin subunit